MEQQNSPLSTVWGSPKDASRTKPTSPVVSLNLSRSCHLMVQTISLVSAEHCAHQDVPAAVLKRSGRFQHGLSSARPGTVPSSAREGNIEPGKWAQHRCHSRRSRAAAQAEPVAKPCPASGSSEPALPLAPTANVSVPDGPPTSHGPVQGWAPELHVPKAPPALQGKEQLWFPSEPNVALHCWELKMCQLHGSGCFCLEKKGDNIS